MSKVTSPGPRVQNARVDTALQFLPAIQALTLVDAVLLTLYFRADGGLPFFLVWNFLVLCQTGGWAWFALRRPGHRLPKTDRTPWLYAQAVLEGLIFGGLTAWLFPVVDPGKAVVLGAFATGLQAAGTLMKYPLPGTAVVFGLLFLVGVEAGLLRSHIPDVAIPMVFDAAFFGATQVLTFLMNQMFEARISAEEDLDRQNTLVTHLLNDLEESASEGLWETDADGRVTLISARLTQVLGIEASSLEGRPLVPRAEWATTLARGQSFRGLEVPVEVSAERRWWSLTGKPLKTADGVIEGWRGVASDITGLRRQELERLRLTRYDPLTGLLNRDAFRRLFDELAEAPGPGEFRSLVLIDLVGFRDINESRGHAFGDAVLRTVADRLHRQLPETTLLARLDGDEFALSDTVEGSTKEARRNLETLAEELTTPLSVQGQTLTLGLRFGVAFLPEDATDAEGLWRCADLALRAAKGHARTQVVFYEARYLDEFRHRNSLREDLKRAQDRHELWVSYQPQVSLETEAVVGFEALMRWTHPTRGPVSPAEFIPLAEEANLITGLGLWILEEACLQALTWPAHVKVSVNVAAAQLASGTLAAQVGRILGRLGFDPGRLTLEVTESSLILHDPVVAQTLTALKALGLDLALDDFGTGYSALAYLQAFPFDELKIDQSFVRPATAPGKSPALLASIVSLARSLGLRTTAEGIENEAQLSLLRALDCDVGQGFWFGRPVGADEVKARWAEAGRTDQPKTVSSID